MTLFLANIEILISFSFHYKKACENLNDVAPEEDNVNDELKNLKLEQSETIFADMLKVH